jgi:serine/threonine-protein kinase
MNHEQAGSAGNDALDQILAEYLLAAERGQEPSRRVLLARHPDLAQELEDFFARRDGFQRLAAPLCLLGAESKEGPADPQQTTAQGKTGETAAGLALPCAFGDYELLEELGQGAMGVVYRARQKSADRLVAIKMIRSGALASAAEAQRFRNEAQTVAGLDHPHIVPVYEVGEHDGQPFFSMKLIEGPSLAEQLPRYRADARAATRLVVQVSRAVHHAHQRGVLHRDLKPANILLDAESRPYVSDFGLAKRAEIEGSLTQSGAIVGTPAYMAPEQASGVRGALTTAADVYGLGALLYALLCGRPPFQGPTVLETLLQVREQEPESPRAGNPQVARDLETICLKCLHKEPARRYGSAEELAADLERYLTREPILARRISWAARTVRWARRRPAAATLVGVGLVVALGGGVTWWAWNEDRVNRAAEAAQKVAVAKEGVRTALGEMGRWQKEKRWSEAGAALERARAWLVGADLPQERRQVEIATVDLTMVTAVDEIRLRRSTAVTDGQFDHAGAYREYALAFANYGLDVAGLPFRQLADRLRASTIRDDLIVALDDWNRCARPGAVRMRLLLLAQVADDNRLRRHLREFVLRLNLARRKGPERKKLDDVYGEWFNGLAKRREILEEVKNEFAVWLKGLSKRADLLDQPSATLSLLAQVLKEVGYLPEAIELLRQAQVRHMADFWINHELGLRLMETGPASLAEAVAFLRTAVGLRPESPGARQNLAYALYQQGKLADAVAVLETVVALKRDYVQAYYVLGHALMKQGRFRESADAFRRAAELKTDNADYHYNLGIARDRLSDRVGAITAFRKAIALRPGYVEARHNLGIELAKQGEFGEAVAIFRKLLAEQPANADFHSALGQALSLQGKLPQAVSRLRHALELNPDHAPSCISLGAVLAKQRQLDEAVRLFRRGIALDPTNADAHFQLGVLLREQARPAEAADALREAIKFRPDHALAHYDLGATLARQGRRAEAAAAYRRAGELNPDHAEAHYNLGCVLADLNQLAEAAEAYQRAIACRPTFAEAHCNLGHALIRQGKVREAVTAYRRGHELGSPRPGWPFPSEKWLAWAEEAAGLEARHPGIWQGQVTGNLSPDELSIAARTLWNMQRFAVSAQLLAGAFASRPELAERLGYSAACAAAMVAGGNGEGASALAEKDRARWRQQALQWLKADLERKARQITRASVEACRELEAVLRQWLREPALAGLRDPVGLARLPAPERADWQKLWQEVEALRQRATSPSVP